jgi:hypothetical protein
VIYTARLTREGAERRGTVTLGPRGTFALSMRRTGLDAHGQHTAMLAATQNGRVTRTSLRFCCDDDWEKPWFWAGWAELGAVDPWEFFVRGQVEGADLVLTFDDREGKRRTGAVVEAAE